MIVLLRYVHIFYALIGFKLKKKKQLNIFTYIQIHTNVYDPYIYHLFRLAHKTEKKHTFMYTIATPKHSFQHIEQKPQKQKQN